MVNKTTIQLTNETKKKLKILCANKDVTYEELIKKMLKETKQK